jgi:hypothetical protein
MNAAAAEGRRRHAGLAPDAEPAFSEMIDRWLEEGDRLSEAGMASETKVPIRRRRQLPGFVTHVGASANRHRVAVMSGLGLLGLLALLGAYRPSTESKATVPVAALATRPSASSGLLRGVAPPEGEPAPAPERPRMRIEAPAAVIQAAKRPEPAEPVASSVPVPAEPPAPPVIPTAEPPALPARATGELAPPPTTVPAVQPALAANAAAEPPLRPGLPANPVAGQAVKPAALAATPPAEPAQPMEACRTALKRERAREALSACRVAADRAPSSADALVLLAHADLLAGREGETLRLAQRASEIDPGCADAYLLIGNVQQSVGNKPHARRAYEAYLQLAPHGDHAAEVRAVLGTL